jgi:DNA polymerase III epsilon subunit family exonuclease
MPTGRGLLGSAWRRINVGGRFYRGSVISPGVTSRVPNECEEAPSAQDTQPRPNGRELKGFAPGTSAAELSLAAGVGLGLASAGPGGSGLGGAELGGLAEVDLGLLEFAVVDLETTGWSPEQAAITEIGAVRVRAGARRGEFVRQGEFASLVNPGTPVPPGIADLTGITDWMLAAAPRLGAVLPGLLDFAQGCVLVAHNAPFDLGFLVAGCGDLGLAWPGFTVLDTVMLARRVMDPDEVPDCKLGTLAGFFGARTAPNHRALADARATADVLSWLIRRLTHRGIRTLRQLSAWPDVVA